MEEFRNFDDIVREELQDPQEAQAYLDVAIELYEEDGDTQAFLMALRDVVEAQGGLGKLAQRTPFKEQKLDALFASKKKPEFSTVGAILHGLGFTLSVKSLPPPPPNH